MTKPKSESHKRKIEEKRIARQIRDAAKRFEREFWREIGVPQDIYYVAVRKSWR